jgi:putative FmdB family regulatory protein
MPIFEYQCEECSATFERLTLRSQAAAQMTCPQCGSTQTAKIFSTFSTTAGSNVSADRGGNPSFS